METIQFGCSSLPLAESVKEIKEELQQQFVNYHANHIFDTEIAATSGKMRQWCFAKVVCMTFEEMGASDVGRPWISGNMHILLH